MSLPNPSKGWRSSSSRLLALYSSLFVLWSGILMGVMYYEVSAYLDNLAKHSLMQRQHLFSRFSGEQLVDALAVSMTFDIRGIDAYGLFDAQHRYLSGALRHIPEGLPLDGKIHMLSDCADSDDPTLPSDSCDAVATQTVDGRWLVLVRDNGSLFAVTRIILHALFWGVTLTIVPGIVGWHLLRRRPLRRIRGIQASAEAIVAGDLTRRLPLSNRRDELDMLAAIVNAMLERIERLMNEVKGVCDNIAHDLRTPLTRLRAQLYRMQQQAGEGSPAGGATGFSAGRSRHPDGAFSRIAADFRAGRSPAAFRFCAAGSGAVAAGTARLLPAAGGRRRTGFQLQLPESLPPLNGDRALLFEAVANLLSNSIKFTPPGGEVILRGVNEGGHTRIEVLDSGPGHSRRPNAKRCSSASIAPRVAISKAGSGWGCRSSRRLSACMGLRLKWAAVNWVARGWCSIVGRA